MLSKYASILVSHVKTDIVIYDFRHIRYSLIIHTHRTYISTHRNFVGDGMNKKYIIAQFEYGIAHQLYTDGLITFRQLEEIKLLIKIGIEAGDYNDYEKSGCILSCVNG